MRLEFIHKNYPLAFPFKLSYGTYYEREAVLVTIREGNHTGYGELSMVPYYGKDFGAVLSDLKKTGEFLSGIRGEWTPEDLYKVMADSLRPDPIVLSAADCALYDLYGKKTDRPVWALTGGRQEVEAVSSLTLTGDDWAQKLNYHWPELKLKMGFEGDMELLEKVRAHYSGPLRIDANSGWSVAELEERVGRLEELGVALIEQPVSSSDDEQLAEKHYPIPLAADESLQGIEDLERLAGIYQVVNIKLQKSGGITPSLKMIERARELGLRLMAGCMTESSVGIGAMAHLASRFDYLDLDGEYLIKNKIGEDKFVKKGKILLSRKSGLGMEFDLER